MITQKKLKECKKKVIGFQQSKITNRKYLKSKIADLCKGPFELNIDDDQLIFHISISDNKTEIKAEKLREELFECIPAGWLIDIK